MQRDSEQSGDRSGLRPAADPRRPRRHPRRPRPRDRPRPLDRRPARRRPARPRARLRGRRQRLDRRPPADRPRVQPPRGRRARRRPRRDALAPGGQRPRRHAARRGDVRDGHRRGPGGRARPGARALHRAARRRRARRADDVRGIGVGVPGPVQFATGEAVNPPIMPGWNHFRIPDWFAERYDAPVLVDNDVNIMALGEHWSALARGRAPALRQGRHRHRLRHRRRAGDPPRRPGRARATSATSASQGHDDVVCRCGNVGCLEAVAGGRALARRLTEAGLEASSSRDVVRLVARAATRARCGWSARPAASLGEVLAGVRELLQPRASSSSAATSARPTSSCSPACAR